ncbi:MAG: aspartate ammonia-lyase [Bacteroidales bacterium]|nr:aspartate ammonia-lyase [Bacteroidales bacterium]MBQ9255415.1 aspartate ammonia-lyase [Bacteroidales bacterium]MBQ9311496.1 aspartate ammonia-lyase [Bacteroidales bacterium]
MANSKIKTRKESDLIGELEVPVDALYGVQSLRGFNNFKISGVPMNHYPNFIKGFAYTKWGAAEANYKQKKLTKEQHDAMVKACKEMLDGKLDEYFLSDMIQGGAGTTVNMNANEVIANRALQIMGHKPGEYKYCSPNDHSNASQSTNDAYPTGFHFGLYLESAQLLEAMEACIKSLDAKAKEFKKIVKMGRTQLQDGVPMTLGQTFAAFATTLKKELKELKSAREELLCVNMGATAIGTGICAEPGYSELCIEALRKITGWNVTLEKDLVEATSATGSLVGLSSELKRIALKAIKICNDLRLMGSGPRCGLAEVHLPEMQPGSSIMPGKVNPVIPEVMNQLCYKVIGNDTAVMLGSENAQLELNVMEPVMVYCLFESIDLLTNGFNTLRTLCIDGIEADVENCKNFIAKAIGTVTALNPYIGYKNSTRIAKIAKKTGKGVYEIALENKVLSQKDLDTIFAPENMIKPVNLPIKADQEKIQKTLEAILAKL